MKLVEFTDENGYKRKSLVPEGAQPSQGLIQSPPDLEQLDWAQVKRTLHNHLLDKGILSLEDAQKNNAELMWCIKVALTKPLLKLYQED